MSEVGCGLAGITFLNGLPSCVNYMMHYKLDYQDVTTTCYQSVFGDMEFWGNGNTN